MVIYMLMLNINPDIENKIRVIAAIRTPRRGAITSVVEEAFNLYIIYQENLKAENEKQLDSVPIGEL